ncbi:hypothetical protein LCGC14_0947780 [marine sediment metagenome]|uniref:Uncharacterized protein n=1 Tax=marine sediment metagenome TaxID=412755 RepID=A0A0F9RPK0_9ZZZZ
MDLESLSKTVEYMKNKVDMIVSAIVGDPTDESKPGLLIRLDRIERFNAALKWVLALFGSAFAMIIAALVIKWV